MYHRARVSARLATIHTESIPGLSGRPECVVAVIEGPDQGATAVIPYEGEVTVGTDAGCALRLTDGRVSHRHLTIRLTADGQIRNCLFARDETDVRATLRDASLSDEERRSRIAGLFAQATMAKLPGHGINDPSFIQPDRPMSAIGG